MFDTRKMFRLPVWLISMRVANASLGWLKSEFHLDVMSAALRLELNSFVFQQSPFMKEDKCRQTSF